MDLGSTQVIQDNFPHLKILKLIVSAKILSPDKVMSTSSRDVEADISFGKAAVPSTTHLQSNKMPISPDPFRHHWYSKGDILICCCYFLCVMVPITRIADIYWGTYLIPHKSYIFGWNMDLLMFISFCPPNLPFLCLLTYIHSFKTNICCIGKLLLFPL